MKTSTSTPPAEPLAVFTSAKATDLNGYVNQLFANIDLSIGAAERKIAQLEAAEEAANAAEINQDAIRSKGNQQDRKADDVDQELPSSIMDKSSSNDRRDSRSRSDRDDEAHTETHILVRELTVAGRTIRIETHFRIEHREDNAIVTTINPTSRDRTEEHSIESARSLYKTLRTRGFNAE